MAAIRKLSAAVVNKIAAGEVIERPASVVKELLENSVDAGARRIDVSVERGGVDAIVISDDGCGISADDLPLAVSPHATSKIADADDLFHVDTLGFRGEALASIAEVSRFRICSRTTDDDAAAELIVDGGVAGELRPAGRAPGTTIEVRDLFFTTPVRRKFLRTTQTEVSHVAEAVQRLALANPSVSFSLRHNDRAVFDLPAVDDVRRRIGELFGEEIAAALIEVSSGEGDVRLDGFVAQPEVSRGNNRTQYVFLNGRFIRDRALQHALAEAYRGLLMVGRHPVCFLNLTMPPELVDVNVHPTKLEVRFVDGGKIYAQLLSTLRNRFLSSDLTARWTPSRRSDSPGGPAPFKPFPALAASASQLFRSVGPGPGRGLELVATAAPEESPSSTATLLAERPPVGETTNAEAPTATTRPADAPIASLPPTRVMQVMNTYLVAETDDGVLVIDQHALHERVLYEQIRERVLSSGLEAQRLLAPEPVALSPSDREQALAARDEFARLGMEIGEFGEGGVAVYSVPAMLRRAAPADLLRELLDRRDDGSAGSERRDLLDAMMQRMSCRAAVKAGDPLSGEEIDALLASRSLVQDHHHCPHGRPTALVFTREALDKQFGRI